MRVKYIHTLFFILLTSTVSVAQSYSFNKSSFVYKSIDTHDLEIVMYKPKLPEGGKLPALVLFFGGGWTDGNTDHFALQAEYFATRGMVVFCPEYRIKSKHETTPFESVKDAKSAIRYLKINSEILGIDSARIVAGGGSAGGHLAACTAVIKNINEASDDLSISAEPHALVLFNPVVDTGKRGYGQEKLGGREFEISPIHRIVPGVPPTLIMHGSADKTVPFENVVRFKQLMKQAGNRCILVNYKHQDHGFFNYAKKPKYFKRTLVRTELFLSELELLQGEPWINKYMKKLKENYN